MATSNTYTANTTAGNYNVVASAPGATPTISFAMTNLAGSAHTVTATSGSGQSATVGTAFTNPLGATVTDQYGNPVSGVTVTFTPPGSGASGTFTTSATAVTNAAGLATSNTYTANTIAGGPYNVVASATGAASANFAETNTAKTTNDTLSLVSGTPQSATVNTAFGAPLVVKDVDQYGNLVSGVTVTFAPPGSGASGTFTTSATAVTNTSGVATSHTYTANTTAGSYNVVASAPGATPTISFAMTNNAGSAHTVTATSGTNQSATVSTAFTNPLGATVTDQYGNPVSGVTVTFTPPTGSVASGTFTTSATAVTNPAGLATSNTYTANTIAGGPYNVVASAPGATTSASFPETNLAGSAHTVTATSGSGQSATVGTAFTNPLGATVTDQYNNPVSGVTVTFTPPTGTVASGTFTTSATAVTNAAGLATSNTYTANTTAGGPYNVVASATGAASANFAETNTAKTTNDTLSLVSGTPQSATVNTAFGAPLVVKDVDQYGNLVSGVTVTFTPPGSGASGTFTSSATAVTNPAGVATSNTYTANTTAGNYNVVASAPGATPTISFAMTNLAGSAHTVTATSGSGQSATVGTAFTNPLGATVTDQYGNPVSGVTVTFTPPGSGASGTFTTSATAVTNAAGLATSNTYTANTIAGGPYNVVASATGAASANFAETNTAKTTNDTLSLVSGTPQSATVNTAFGAPLVVKDVDQYGNLVSGVTVTFAPPGSGASGTFTTSATAVTNTSGVATSHTYTANTTAGSYNVVASAPGATPTISFAMTNNAGSAHTVTATSGTNQSATVSTAFTNPLGATVTDQYGNPVSGVTVTFTPPTGSVASGTFTTSATAVTNPAGLATSNTYTANTIAGGPYNVVASAPGATTSASFPETNLAGSAHTVTATSGSGQSATVGTAFTNPLGATVTDQYNNPVSGVTVTFTPPTGTVASGTFTTSATAVTNAAGLATSNTYTANTIAGGPYNVVASATGAASANFAETNRVALTAQSVASGTGTTSVPTTAFTQTSGKTYLITAYESSSGFGTPTTPTPVISGGGTATLIVTNNFGGTSSPNCSANDCYEWSWWYNATASTSTTVTLGFTNTPQASVVNVLALSGNSTTTPIVTASTSTASSTSSTTITANTLNAPASGDITLQLLASDNQIGTAAVTWTPASTNLYFHNAATATNGASLQVNWASPGQQNETASASGFSGSQDWGTIALEIGHSVTWAAKDHRPLDRKRSRNARFAEGTARLRRRRAAGENPRGNEDGAVLILALVFLVSVSLIIVGLLTWVGTSLSATTTFGQSRTLEAATTSAMDLAIQNSRFTFASQMTNASPPSACWYASGVPQQPQVLQGYSIDVWCSMDWQSSSAATRTITYSACPTAGTGSPTQTTDPATCASQPLLQAVMTYDDYAPGLIVPFPQSGPLQ